MLQPQKMELDYYTPQSIPKTLPSLSDPPTLPSLPTPPTLPSLPTPPIIPSLPTPPTFPKRVHFCAHCDYNSTSRWHVARHQSRKHKILKEKVKECPVPIQNEEQPKDRDLMEDSIQVFKIYKLLQRMKNN